MNEKETPLHHYPATPGLDLAATGTEAWAAFFQECRRIAAVARQRRAAKQAQADGEQGDAQENCA